MDILSKCFDFCMKEEGGSLYTNDPRDPGGPTKYGVALNCNREVIPDKNRDGKINAEDVKLLEKSDALKIYRDRYFIPNKCDKLPVALAFLYADMVFNPGPGISPKLLQMALNSLGADLVVDGKIGPKTLSAITIANLKALVTKLSDLRLDYYQSRPNWKVYGRGWTNRTNRCVAEALKLVNGE